MIDGSGEWRQTTVKSGRTRARTHARRKWESSQSLVKPRVALIQDFLPILNLSAWQEPEPTISNHKERDPRNGGGGSASLSLSPPYG